MFKFKISNLVSIVFFIHLFYTLAFSQIGIIMSTESIGKIPVFIGSANMDSDPNDELVYVQRSGVQKYQAYILLMV